MIWAIILTWVVLAFLFIVSEQFGIPQIMYIIAFPAYIIIFPIHKLVELIQHTHIRNNYGCYHFGNRMLIMNYKLAKQFTPERVKLYRAGKDFKSFPHKKELVNTIDELREMGYTDKFLDEMKQP